MKDVWTKQAQDGKTIVLKKEGSKDDGFVYTAEGRTTTEAEALEDDLTKEEVEQLFATYLAGKAKAPQGSETQSPKEATSEKPEASQSKAQDAEKGH